MRRAGETGNSAPGRGREIEIGGIQAYCAICIAGNISGIGAALDDTAMRSNKNEDRTVQVVGILAVYVESGAFGSQRHGRCFGRYSHQPPGNGVLRCVHRCEFQREPVSPVYASGDT